MNDHLVIFLGDIDGETWIHGWKRKKWIQLSDEKEKKERRIEKDGKKKR